jgi:hydroxymethylpyrimidine/phosphomethylpyrimidine kinase
MMALKPASMGSTRANLDKKIRAPENVTGERLGFAFWLSEFGTSRLPSRAMPKAQKIPVALTIAGSDSGGGAGIQADLKTFASLDVHGTSAITCLTAQNPEGVYGIQAARPELVRKQIEAVLSSFHPKAIKTGMLYSRTIIETVVACLKGTDVPLIVDPVMIATSGARLLQPAAVAALKNGLLPAAALVTPNLPEAEALLGMRIRDPEDMRSAARAIRERWGCAALIKGGHLQGGREAVDIFLDESCELLLSAPMLEGVSTHGTGCTFSAAIAGYAARGFNWPHAVQLGKEYITQAIAQRVEAAGHKVLNPFWSWMRSRPGRWAAKHERAQPLRSFDR